MTQKPPHWPKNQPYWRSGGNLSTDPRRVVVSPVIPPVPPTPPVDVNTLDIVLPPSSFMTDARASYDGAVGGTLGFGSFVAIPGLNAVPNRVFWFSQRDSGTVPRALDPTNWIGALAGYTGIQVILDAGLVTAQDVALDLQAAMAVFPEYTVTQVGSVWSASWQMRVQGEDIDAVNAFTGGSFATRGDAGLWGCRVNQVNTLPFGTFEGGATSANASHATSPANATNRIIAMDLFVGSVHNAGDQLRLALYEGGTAVSPVGATLVYDFGQITGTGTDQWVRLWVNQSDIVTVGSAVNLWLIVKGDVGTTQLRVLQVGSGWQGNFTDQDFFVTTIAPAAGTAYPATVPAGGGASGFNLILAMRLIYDSPPYATDGSWLRTFGIHTAIGTAGSEIGIDSQLMMGGNPPQALGMELDWHETPYGPVHTGQFRTGVYQGGVVANPNNAPRIADLGQTVGAVTEAYVRVNAPGPGPTAIPVDISSAVWWTIKNNSGGAGGNARVRFSLNADQGNGDPPENPSDWTRATVPPAGDGSEYELFATNPTIDTDPTTPFVATISTDASDQLPGNQPYARLGFRVNGIGLIAS
jgi:hypothetical protein